MQVIPLDQIKGMEEGMPVPCVRGTLTAVYGRKSGETDKGPWSFQNCVLKDPSGQVNIKLKDRDELPGSMKGKPVIISCVRGDKGLTGIKTKDDKYKDKVTRILWVTPSATIETVDAAQSATQPAQGPPAQETQPTPAAPAPEPPKPTEQPAPTVAPATNGNGVRKALNKYANLYLDCLFAGRYVRDTYNQILKNETMSDDQFQACVSSLFIQATRDCLAGEVAGGTYQHK